MPGYAILAYIMLEQIGVEAGRVFLRRKASGRNGNQPIFMVISLNYSVKLHNNFKAQGASRRFLCASFVYNEEKD